jgi:transposase-like protein
VNSDEAREYSESLGEIFDGGYRQVAWADKQKIPKSLGLTTREWVFTYLGGYTRMGVEQRNEAVKELAADGMSQDGIARSLGVSDNTVRAIIQGEEPQAYRNRTPPAAEIDKDRTPPAAPLAGDQSIDLAEMQKGANLAAKHDEIAAFYGAIKALSWLALHIPDDEMIRSEFDAKARLEMTNRLEEYDLLLRKLQSAMAVIQ